MPSQFEIAVASLQRLVKEESSYHEELKQQKRRLARLEGDTSGANENLSYQIKQEVGMPEGYHWFTKLINHELVY